MQSAQVGVGPDRKRPRAARACEWCRSKKYRCDERDPCSRCTRARVPCVYKDAHSFRHRASCQEANCSHQLAPESPALRIDAATVSQTNAASATADSSLDVQDGEVTVINHSSREFHGRTSILAFLNALQRSAPRESQASAELGTEALAAAFHNDSFSPEPTLTFGDLSLGDTRFYFRQSQYFLDGYFQNIHFIHPIIDRSDFLARCEDLWFGRHGNQSRSFIALYLAVMSLGALTREWSEDQIDGLGRWDWSRKLFHLASLSLEPLSFKFELETVQANIILAKVCQNELNPSLAYSYLGMAVRTSLSAGHNRRPGPESSSKRPLEDSAICKTWWGLYSLEVETSFALGRPDSLGSDLYHNCPLPPVEDNETAILSPMVEFARIVRKVAACVYTEATTMDRRMNIATEIEAELACWVQNLPVSIRPHLDEPTESMGVMKDRLWAKKQRHTLRFRYYNILMVLYRPVLMHIRRPPSLNAVDDGRRLDDAVLKCVSAARSTIRLMHHMFSHSSYFRTWYYNITYNLYASSIILGYHTRLAPQHEKPELVQLIKMSVEVLRAMEENIVARKAAQLLQDAASLVQERDDTGQLGLAGSRAEHTNHHSVTQPASENTPDQLSAHDFMFDSLRDADFDFMAQVFALSDSNFTF